ncbi:hypothetical protein GCM10025877_22480 [Agromyces mangrovi Wang et al. 2018]|nr:hypothetical protein GCM10025877_22480 [Agromyces mangrovi]
MYGMTSASVTISSTVATAPPMPNWWLVNDCVYDQSASTCVDCAGPPPVMPTTRSKTFSALMIVRITTTTVVGRSAGMVTAQNRCQAFAPSSFEASMSSTGTVWRPARNSTMLNPTACQMLATKIEPSANCGSPSQDWVQSSSPMAVRNWFTNPSVGL